MMTFELFQLSDKPLNVAELAASLTDNHAGALVSFEGRVRDTNEGKAVTDLEYEAYPSLSLAEGTAVVREAMEGVIAARCVHRVGRLSVGDVAVWIGVTAGHRDQAFRACRYIIDEVKRRVPIWKKERYADGSSEWIGLGNHPAAGRSPSKMTFKGSA
jgi:molybdopterin synthase catalytic subunit